MSRFFPFQNEGSFCDKKTPIFSLTVNSTNNYNDKRNNAYCDPYKGLVNFGTSSAWLTQ